MSTLRIIVLMHEGLLPPVELKRAEDRKTADRKTEYDVVSELSKPGHEVRQLGVSNDLTPIRDAIIEWKRHIAFHLL